MDDFVKRMIKVRHEWGGEAKPWWEPRAFSLIHQLQAAEKCFTGGHSLAPYLRARKAVGLSTYAIYGSGPAEDAACRIGLSRLVRQVRRHIRGDC